MSTNNASLNLKELTVHTSARLVVHPVCLQWSVETC